MPHLGCDAVGGTGQPLLCGTLEERGQEGVADGWAARVEDRVCERVQQRLRRVRCARDALAGGALGLQQCDLHL